ncbi:hypothetical protein KSS87_005311, partial [Heliosperma pusillum]
VTSKKDQEQYWQRRDVPYHFITSKEFAEAFKCFHVGRKLNQELLVTFDRTKSHPAALTTQKYGVEISMTVGKLPVFYKHHDLLFFPSWAYTLPNWILKVPITFVEVTILVSLTYYVIGFDSNVGRMFKYYLILVLVNQMASGLFKTIASLGRTMVVSNTFGSCALLGLFVLGGFVLSKDNIKKWWIWGYWASPMMYAQNAVVVNEFLGHSWSKTNIAFYTYAAFKTAQAIPNDEDDDKINNTNGNGGKIIVQAAQDIKRKGMILPFEQHLITFDEVRYSVDMPKEMKVQGVMEDKLELLKGVSGAFRPGVLTALMGVSGAGKTTLMDVLAGRKTGGYIEGDIKISGYPKKQETFARISGYCEQNDIHSPYVTVYESLVYSAWLRLSSDVNPQTREMFVEEVMELVELAPLRGALVGLPGVSGLSTEQRKRLTIAVELVANPSIIFMDEPTSGLDARAAAIVMRTVRNTVDTGRTVVCTIHQPSIDIFEAFDELFLMKRGGQEIYVGPLGHHSCDLINYFESIQGVHKITDGYNPATWMLEVSTPAQELALSVDFANLYKNSDLYRRNKELIQELGTPQPGSKDLHFKTQYSQPFKVQTMACLWKQNWSYWRNPMYTAVRFLFTTAIAIMFGTIFWQLEGKTKSQDLFNAMGSMYAAVLFIGVQNASSVQPIVAIERTVFYREKAAGMYSALPYAFAQALIEIPYIFVQALVYGVIVYAMIGFEWTAAKFLWYLFFMFFTLCYFTYYGMMTVAITPNHHVAAIIASAFYGIWNLFSGYLIQLYPNRKYPYGGDGTTTFAQSHGPCTVAEDLGLPEPKHKCCDAVADSEYDLSLTSSMVTEDVHTWVDSEPEYDLSPSFINFELPDLGLPEPKHKCCDAVADSEYDLSPTSSMVTENVHTWVDSEPEYDLSPSFINFELPGDGVEVSVDRTPSIFVKCRPGRLLKLISQLNHAQREAVKRIGFGGLLDLRLKHVPNSRKLTKL